MQTFIQGIMELFGLGITPITNDFVGIFVWFTMLMSGVCVTCGFVKMLFFITLNARKVVG